MLHKVLVRLQVGFLVCMSALLLLGAPQTWNFSPDSGIYVGTAHMLAETGAYWFNGHPNLLYYPGLSGLLSLTILAFGLDFHVMHLLVAAIAVASLWLARAYFGLERYGVAGLAVPVALLAAGIFMRQAFVILSDGLFLAVVLAALLLWRRYAEAKDLRALVACCLLAAIAPLVRYQGLFLSAALGIALLFEAYRHDRLDRAAFVRIVAIGLVVVAPFVLWTIRNLVLHTPDTHVVLNGLFFGLPGLTLQAPAAEGTGFFSGYAIQRLVLFIAALGKTLLSAEVMDTLPLAIWIVAIVSLAAAGARPWLKRATAMEWAFVAIVLAFQLLWTLRGGGGPALYVVPRYWLPVLPFVLVMIGFGLAAAYSALGATPARHLVTAVSVALLATVVVTGSWRLSYHTGRKIHFYQQAASVIEETAAYFAANVPTSARIATTDWGVMPFRLGRASYQIVNDPSYRLALERMRTYDTSYLVILDHLDGYPRLARDMVGAYPEVFRPVFETHFGAEDEPSAAVFAVDMPALEAALTRPTNGMSTR